MTRHPSEVSLRPTPGALRYLWRWAQEKSAFAKTAGRAFPKLDLLPMGLAGQPGSHVELRHWNGDRMLRVWIDYQTPGCRTLVVRLERPLSRQNDQTTLNIPRAVARLAMAEKG